jgi:hypothetical protein
MLEMISGLLGMLACSGIYRIFGLSYSGNDRAASNRVSKSFQG